MFGYPKNIEGGEYLHYYIGQSFKHNKMRTILTYQKKGASGGAWTVNRYVVGLNSAGEGAPDIMYGSIIENAEINLFHQINSN